MIPPPVTRRLAPQRVKRQTIPRLIRLTLDPRLGSLSRGEPTRKRLRVCSGPPGLRSLEAACALPSVAASSYLSAVRNSRV